MLDNLRPKNVIDTKTKNKGLKTAGRRLLRLALRLKAPMFALYGAYKLLSALLEDAAAAEYVFTSVEYTALALVVRLVWTLFKTWYLVSHVSEDIDHSARFASRVKRRVRRVGENILARCIASLEARSNRPIAYYI